MKTAENALVVKLVQAKQSKDLADTNAPCWRKPAQGRKGYWYVWVGRDKVTLTKFGAIAEANDKPSKESRASSWVAWEAYKQNKKTGQAEVVKQLQAEVLEAVKVITVADVIENYRANQLPKLNESTARVARNALDRFAYGHQGGRGIKAYKGWGELPAGSVTFGLLKTWKGYHTRASLDGFSSNFTYVKAAFYLAAKQDDNGKRLIPVNPLEGFKFEKGKRREGIITAEAEASLRAIMSDKYPELEVFFSACMALGCRPGELAKLQRRHWDVKSGRFILQADEWKCGIKTGKLRYIAVVGKLLAWVKTHFAEMSEHEHFFKTARGNAWTSNSWGKAWKTVRKLAGLPTTGKDKLDLYHTRHTAISTALAKDVPIAAVASACGTSLAMIDRTYNQNDRDAAMQRQAALAMGGA